MEAGFDVSSLADRISGDVARPGDDGWDQARQAWNLIADQNPEAVVAPATAEDVAATVAFARDAGLRVTAQALGHGAVAMAPLDGTLLIRTTGLDGIEVDAGRGVARAGAGVIWRDLMNAAGEQGMSALGGSSPNVSVIPYSLGGGYSWMSRRYGLACNSVRSIEVVTADGELRTVDAETEPELFWALRGGGGNFGVVTAMEINLLPLGQVYAGTMVFPAEDVEGKLRAWRDWTRTAPDEVSSIARVITPPPLPDVPEPLRGRMVVTVGVCFTGDEAAGAELVAPLRKLGEPIMDMLGPMPAAGLVEIHMDPEPPVPGLVHHALLGELPDEAIDTFVAAVGPGSGTMLLSAEIRHAGGAMGRPAEGGGVLDSLDAAYLMLAVGLPMAPEQAEPIAGSLDSLHDAMGPWSTGGAYMNFAERPTEAATIFPPETLARLGEVKAKWDPSGMIRANHQLASPAAA